MITLQQAMAQTIADTVANIEKDAVMPDKARREQMTEWHLGRCQIQMRTYLRYGKDDQRIMSQLEKLLSKRATTFEQDEKDPRDWYAHFPHGGLAKISVYEGELYVSGHFYDYSCNYHDWEINEQVFADVESAVSDAERRGVY